MRKYVNEDGFMMKGQYEGDLLSDVADGDPDYLQNLLENARLVAEERAEIEAALNANVVPDLGETILEAAPSC